MNINLIPIIRVRMCNRSNILLSLHVNELCLSRTESGFQLTFPHKEDSKSPEHMKVLVFFQLEVSCYIQPFLFGVASGKSAVRPIKGLFLLCPH
jgi:hypothetical protein